MTDQNTPDANEGTTPLDLYASPVGGTYHAPVVLDTPATPDGDEMWEITIEGFPVDEWGDSLPYSDMINYANVWAEQFSEALVEGISKVWVGEQLFAVIDERPLSWRVYK